MEALSNLATAPLNANRKLFQRSQRNPTYSGGLATKPDAWVLPLVHFGRDKNGVKPLNGPGNIAIDKQGNLWISNNYTPFAPQGKPPFPGNTLINLDPGGNLIQDTPLQGGGLYGAGYGIGIDPDGQIWVGNYGFGGRNAFTDQPALIPLRGNGNSVSRFGPQGQVRSRNGSKVPQRVPTGGITRGRMLGPQGIVADQQGNIWIASNRETRTQDSKVVLYLDGLPKNPSNPRPFKHPNLSQPFDIAIDAEGDAWVAYTEGGRFNNGGVVELRYNERTQRFASRTYTDRRFNGPWGIATAKNGEVWFTNNGRRNGSSVSVINPQLNTKETFNLSADKLGAWGISLDTRGNVYLTAFRQQSIYVLSGTRQRVAGQVVKLGELLSPSDGYRIPGILQRATGVELDPAGNLWVANNYQTNPQNFGGRNIIQYVGLGNPVDTPLIGPVASVGPGSKTPPGRRTLFSLANPEILGRTRVRPEDIAVYNRSSGQYGLFSMVPGRD